MTSLSYHDTFDKQIGNIRVLSYGGGAPRWVRVHRTDRDDMAIHNLSMEECRDLHYALGRLLELAA
jgi:hypothetical protein